MSNRTRSFVILIVLAAPLCLTGVLQAATLFQQVGVSSSPNPVGSGARAVGMGGAFIAIADDATAASWNPAGLIQLERPELSIVGACIETREDFASDTHPEIKDTGKTDDCNINYFSASFPFRFYKNMVISINCQRLYEFGRSFDYQYDFSSSGLSFSRDKRFRQNGDVGALGLAYTIEFTPSLSIGATLNIWTDRLFWENGWKATYSEHYVATLSGVLVTTDAQCTDRYSRFRGENANLGLLWAISKYLTLGAVVKTPFTADLHHDFSYTQETMTGPPFNTTESVQLRTTENVHLRMPLSYGMGLAWRVSDNLCFDLDVYRTHWSDYILTDSDGNKFSPIDGRLKSDSNVDDATQVRIGGEYLFIGQRSNIVVPVRAGVFYDPEPAHRDVKDFYGMAAGSGIAYKSFIFDMAYQLRWSRHVDTGNLIATSEADITQHLLLASLIVHF